MTRKEAIARLNEMGFHLLMDNGRTPRAYEQMRYNLAANRIPLKDIVALETNQEGELVAIFENGLDYATGYLLADEETGLTD